jgi:hypothetical protein
MLEIQAKGFNSWNGMRGNCGVHAGIMLMEKAEMQKAPLFVRFYLRRKQTSVTWQ